MLPSLYRNGVTRYVVPKEAVKLINEAERPLLLVGQGVELGGAQEELKAFAEKADIPCGCTLLGLSALPSAHRLNKGMLGMHGNLAPNVKTNECDVLIAVGMRFDDRDRVTGKLETYARQAKVIHLDVDPSEIGKNVPVDVPVLGNCKRTLALLTELIQTHKHTEWIESFRPYDEKEYEQVIRPEVHPESGPLNMGEVVNAVSEATCREAILVRGNLPRSDIGDRCRSEPDDGMPLFQVREKTEHRDFGWYGNDGLLPSGGNWCHVRMSRTHGMCLYGRRRLADDDARAGYRDGAASTGEAYFAEQ